MTAGSIEGLRVLTSIAASKDLDEAMKEKARILIFEYMKVLDKEVEVELRQINEFSAKISGIQL